MDTEKSIIEERIDYLLNLDTNSTVREVVNIFNEYFGEEFVDSYIPVNTVLKECIINYSSIGSFIRDKCGLRGTSDNIEINYENFHINIPVEHFNEFSTKKMKDFPEELLPIIDIYWRNCTRGGSNYIIVRFPNVTVTNENNKSVDIQELYAKLFVNTQGLLQGRFELIRSYYTLDQWNSDYCHSHIPRISTEWQEPCTGSGPINTTMNRLHEEYDSNVWGLFCYELDKFVRVESIAGIPYKRLESIGLTNDTPVLLPNFRGKAKLSGTIISNDLVKDLMKTLIKETSIKVSFINGTYTLGEPTESFWIRVSRIFAKWYNEKYKEGKVKATLRTLLSNEYIRKYIIKEGKVYEQRTTNRRNIIDVQGHHLFNFKGKEVVMTIDETIGNSSNNVTYLLSPKFITKLIQKILIIVNYNYGRQKEATTEETQPEGGTIYF